MANLREELNQRLAESGKKDDIFFRIDSLVEVLENEGYPFNSIVDGLKDYAEFCDDLLL